MTTREKLKALRLAMAKQEIDAYIIPSGDPHQSEYVADCFKVRAWFTGFTGSMGTAIVTQHTAGIWVDSRYYLQAEIQLQGTEWTVFRMGEPNVPTLHSWLVENMRAGQNIGMDGAIFSEAELRKLEKAVSPKRLNCIWHYDLLSHLWDDRPSQPHSPLYSIPQEWIGLSRLDKIALLKAEINKQDANCHLVAALDEIAWILNLRGNDIPYNPVFLSYLWIEEQSVTLYVEEHKLSKELRDELAADGIMVAPYQDILSTIKILPLDRKLLVSPAKISAAVFRSIPQSLTVVESVNPAFIAKANKTGREIENCKKIMKQDCAALVNFWYWLEHHVGKEPMDEISITQKLHSFRAEQPDFISDSFQTICGWGPHGAIVHYSATPETASPIITNQMLLIDSGGQYWGGTTDITRTFALGEVSQQQKQDYTTVLIGVIRLAMATFPQGTRGYQLEILAKQPLWERGINYNHGTGHGVGCFLCVHEGPQSISSAPIDIPLQIGMVCSDEPGIYRQNEYGIRLENLIHVIPAAKTSFAEFYQFETLTLCPFDKSAIIPDMMSDEEKAWLNTYHSKLYDSMQEILDPIVLRWLKDKTIPIQ